MLSNGGEGVHIMIGCYKVLQ